MTAHGKTPDEPERAGADSDDEDVFHDARFPPEEEAVSTTPSTTICSFATQADQSISSLC